MKKMLIFSLIALACALSVNVIHAMVEETTHKDYEEASTADSKENSKKDTVKLWAAKIKAKHAQKCDVFFEQALSAYSEGNHLRWKLAKSRHKHCLDSYRDKAKLMSKMIRAEKDEVCGDFYRQAFTPDPQTPVSEARTYSQASDAEKTAWDNYLNCSKPYENISIDTHLIKSLERKAYNEACPELVKKDERASNHFFNAIGHNRPGYFIEQKRNAIRTTWKELQACRKSYAKSYIPREIKKELIPYESEKPEDVLWRKQHMGCQYLGNRWMLLYEYDRFSKNEESQATKDAYKKLEECGWPYDTLIKAVKEVGFSKERTLSKSDYMSPKEISDVF